MSCTSMESWQKSEEMKGQLTYGMTGHKNVSHHHEVRTRKAKRQRIFAVQMEGVTVPHLPVEDSVESLYTA